MKSPRRFIIEIEDLDDKAHEIMCGSRKSEIVLEVRSFLRVEISDPAADGVLKGGVSVLPSTSERPRSVTDDSER